MMKRLLFILMACLPVGLVGMRPKVETATKEEQRYLSPEEQKALLDLRRRKNIEASGGQELSPTQQAQYSRLVRKLNEGLMSDKRTVSAAEVDQELEQEYRKQYAQVDATIAMMQMFAGQFHANEFLEKRIANLKQKIAELDASHDMKEIREAQEALKSLTHDRNKYAVVLKSYQMKTAKQITAKQQLATITVLVLNDLQSIRESLFSIPDFPQKPSSKLVITEIAKILKTLEPYWQPNQVILDKELSDKLQAADSALGAQQDAARKVSPYLSGGIQLCRNLLNAYRLYIVQPIASKLLPEQPVAAAEEEKKMSWWATIKSYMPSVRATQLATGALAVAYKGYSFFGEPVWPTLKWPEWPGFAPKKPEYEGPSIFDLPEEPSIWRKEWSNWNKGRKAFEKQEKAAWDAHFVKLRKYEQELKEYAPKNLAYEQQLGTLEEKRSAFFATYDKYENTLKTFRTLLVVAAAGAAAYTLYSLYSSYTSPAEEPKSPAEKPKHNPFKSKRYTSTAEKTFTAPSEEEERPWVEMPAQ